MDIKNPYLAVVQAAAMTYCSYYVWEGSRNVRGFEMHKAKRDWELAAAVYRVERRKSFIRKAMTDVWKERNG